MAGEFTLPIPVLLNSLDHLPVPFFSVLEYTLVEDFIKYRPVCVPLAPRYLGHMPVFLQVIDEAVYEFVFAQDDLPSYILPDRFFPDSPFNKLAVFLFCLTSFPAELPEYPVRRETGVRRLCRLLHDSCSISIARGLLLSLPEGDLRRRTGRLREDGCLSG